MERIKPQLVVFKGYPATGKSTLAEKLSKSLGWELIIRDRIKEKLITEGVDEYMLGKRSYELMWNQARGILADGGYCILDTNLNQKVVYDDLSKIQKDTGVRILIIECVCSDETVHRSRFSKRSELNLSKFWIKSWDEYQQYLKSGKNDGDFEIDYPILRVDTSRKLNIKEIARWVSNNSVICGF